MTVVIGLRYPSYFFRIVKGNGIFVAGGKKNLE